MKKIIFYFFFITGVSQLQAQVGIGTDTPDHSAMLQIQSSEKGFLLPKMTSAQRTSIVSPASGLQVYDTNTNSIWYYNGTFWVNTQAMASVGDVKSGIQSNDHSGWVLLDGRAINSLSNNQQAVATSLGLSGNLPNANNAYLVQNGSAIASVSGSNTVTLTQANLPNVNFTGTTASAGSHSHNVDPVAVTTSTTGAHTHNLYDYYFAENNGNNWGWYGTGANTDWDNSGQYYYHATESSGNHNHTVDIPATSSTTDGNHNHSVSMNSGGSNTPINIAPKSLSVNMFIYLGL